MLAEAAISQSAAMEVGRQSTNHCTGRESSARAGGSNATAPSRTHDPLERCCRTTDTNALLPGKMCGKAPPKVLQDLSLGARLPQCLHGARAPSLGVLGASGFCCDCC